MKNKNGLIAATLLAGLAVILGAFGAHGLKTLVSPLQIETFKTGVQYHFYHALAMALAVIISQYIDNQNISYADIGTTFPNLRSFALIDLKTDPSVSSFVRLDLSKNQYVFYSNVMNELTGEQLDVLKTHWQVVHILRGGQVEVILYKKRAAQRPRNPISMTSKF